MKLKVIFLLNCESSKYIAKLFSLSIYLVWVFVSGILNRVSYMSAHVLLNLLNELGKKDKMRGLLSILCLFRNEFNTFNNTRARMLDSFNHMTLR